MEIIKLIKIIKRSLLSKVAFSNIFLVKMLQFNLLQYQPKKTNLFMLMMFEDVNIIYEPNLFIK